MKVNNPKEMKVNNTGDGMKVNNSMDMKVNNTGDGYESK